MRRWRRAGGDGRPDVQTHITVLCDQSRRKLAPGSGISSVSLTETGVRRRIESATEPRVYVRNSLLLILETRDVTWLWKCGGAWRGRGRELEEGHDVIGVAAAAATEQGLTLVHFSAQRKRFMWDTGCMEGLFWGWLQGGRGYWEVFRVYFVSGTAQVELKSGGV